MRPYSLVFFSGTLLVQPTFAADTAPLDSGSSFLQLGLGLALIIALLLGTLWVLKKIALPRGISGSLIRVLGGAAVGPRERVVVVEVAGKWLVLGVAPGSVALLSEREPPVDIKTSGSDSASAMANTAANNPIPEFTQWLKRTVAKRNEK